VTQPVDTFLWQWCRLHELTTTELYTLLAAREAVFVVEQQCAYQELDGLDQQALHLVAWSGNAVAACLRLIAPSVKYTEPAIGRIMTAQAFRGKGLGRELMHRALQFVEENHSGSGIRISAQTHLENFYCAFGFEPVSQPYLEDGIPHIEMLRRPP
jgi:ElaA protein